MPAPTIHPLRPAWARQPRRHRQRSSGPPRGLAGLLVLVLGVTMVVVGESQRAVAQDGPELVSSIPADGTIGVPDDVDLAMQLVFDQPVATQTAVTVAGTTYSDGSGLSIASATVTLTVPNAALNPGTPYTVDIATFDPADLTRTESFAFVTALDNATQFGIVSTVPANGATGVAVDLAQVVASFNTLATGTAPTLTLTPPGGPGVTSAAIVGTDVTFELAAGTDLAPETTYTATVDGVSAVNGRPIVTETLTWTFTTAAEPDPDSLELVSSTPADGATGVSKELTTVVARFNLDLDTGTVPTLTLADPDDTLVTTLAGVVGTGANADRVSFDLSDELDDPLEVSTEHTITIVAGAADTPAERRSFTITFTTGDPTEIVLVSSTPADGAEDVRTDLTGITAMFNVELATATITLRDDPTSDPVVPAADTVIDASNAQVARLPLGTTGLEPSTTYTATIAVTASGDRSASFTVRFTTRAADTAPSLRIAPQIVEVGEPITAFGTGFQPGVQVGFELRDDFPAGTFRSDEVVEVFSDGVGVVDDTGLGAGQRDAPGSFDDIGGATSISLGTTTVETDGTFLTDLATTTLPTGEFVITAEELSGARRSASSEVLIRLADAPLPTPDTDGDGDAVAESLPRTGPWGVPLLSLLGGLLAVAGTGMLLASRRTAPSGAGDRSMFTAGSPPA